VLDGALLSTAVMTSSSVLMRTPSLLLAPPSSLDKLTSMPFRFAPWPTASTSYSWWLLLETERRSGCRASALVDRASLKALCWPERTNEKKKKRGGGTQVRNRWCPNHSWPGQIQCGSSQHGHTCKLVPAALGTEVGVVGLGKQSFGRLAFEKPLVLRPQGRVYVVGKLGGRPSVVLKSNIARQREKHERMHGKTR